ncbi:MAG: AI-2E family transporter [Euryarchaeota archaeon]|mgnify:FL=1|jgi:predicted PurR-regulated permease PerM|nr:AI-2E family transporter [Euryarchaeota archaeon]MBT5639636.1 AI-2E family transporter [Euryarchaeota archaeon]MBT6071899.1 AI-2E family transporter [Euryarchaeota archaeon]MBT6560513.1 AI-2E family transporter [Euryarchaeota archaeon]MBT6776046.1 AI-2E family transporter [Euryarchaeota archaeon]
MTSTRAFRGIPVSTVSDIMVILLISILAIIHLKVVIQPLVIATLLFLLIRPPANWLEQRFGHPLLAYGGLITIIGVIIFLASQVLYSNLTEFTEASTQDRITEAFSEKMSRLENTEIFGQTIDTSGLEELVSIDVITNFATNFVGSIAGFTASAVTIFIFLLFIILEAETLPNRIKAAYPDELARFKKIASNSGTGINTYVITRATVALGQAIIAAIILKYLAIPGWFLWASITFFLDFIPYIGALISMIPPGILALILLEPSVALIMIGLLIANQQAWGAFVEPQLSGQRLDMSPIVLLILVSFWGWAWGIMGAVLGVPLAVIMKIALESDPRTRPIALLLSQNPKPYHEEE